MSRLIAMGDIHGCSTALDALVKCIALTPDDTLVTLGDYVGRGPDTRGVLDRLIAMSGRTRLIPILGNHDEMMLHAREGRENLRFWMNLGGRAALDSYGGTLDRVPFEHFEFLRSCRDCFETEKHFFVHANYKPEVPFNRQDSHTLRWLSLSDYIPPARHCSDKTAVVGHTPQRNGEILDLGYLKCLDTDCVGGGRLTAVDMRGRGVWQVDHRGNVVDPR